MEKIELSPTGLYTFPNNLSKAPQGSLSIADNLVIDKDNIIESRRGQFQYGTQLSVGLGQLDKLFPYRNNLLLNYNSKLALDSDGAGTWVDYPGTYVTPSTYYKMRATESNQNFYFTTNSGIFKLDKPTGTPVASGMPPGLDGTATPTGTTGFLGLNAGCAYRIIWGYTDSNNNEILGAPSQQILAANPGTTLTVTGTSGTTLSVTTTAGLSAGMIVQQGALSATISVVATGTTLTMSGTFAWVNGVATAGYTVNATLSFTVPVGITTNHFYQIYRTVQVSPATVSPNDEEQLVQEGNPTSGQISALTVTYTDSTPDSLLGAFLYTNPSQDGILQSNNQPPYATDMCTFNGYTFYANCKQKQLMPLTLVAVGGSGGISYGTITGNISNLSTTVTTLSATTNLRVGQLVTGTGIPANTTIVSINTGASTMVISNAATATTATLTITYRDTITIGGISFYANATQVAASRYYAAVNSGNPSVDILNAATSLINVINLTSASPVYAFYLSGFSGLPGEIELEERGVGGAVFHTTSSQSSAFVSGNQAVPTSGTTLASTDNTKSNQLFFSKYLQPEAVPIVNYIPVGNADFPILRIIALREAVFILKQDGIFYLTGQTSGEFTVLSLDYTTTIRAPEAVVALNNQVFMFSRQGVVAFNTSGVSIVSRPIEQDLLQLASDLYPNFDSLTFGVSYESDRKYILYTIGSSGDTFATQAFVYNYITQSWTRWVTPRSCGVVNILDDKLYTGNPLNDYVYVERKHYNNSDYADEQYAVSITGASSNTVTLTSVSNVAVGMAISQGTQTANITAINSLVLTLDATLNWVIGAATVYAPITPSMTFNPAHCDNPAITKLFRELTFFFQEASFSHVEVGFTTDYNNQLLYYALDSIIQGGWGTFPWGTVAWGGFVGGEQTIRTYVSSNNSRGHWLIVNLKNSQCFEKISLQGFSLEWNPVSSRQR